MESSYRKFTKSCQILPDVAKYCLIQLPDGEIENAEITIGFLGTVPEGLSPTASATIKTELGRVVVRNMKIETVSLQDLRPMELGQSLFSDDVQEQVSMNVKPRIIGNKRLVAAALFSLIAKRA